MIASLLAALLLVSPARAATVRVEADVVSVPRVTPLSSPLSAPAPSLTVVAGLSAAPSAFIAPESRVAPALSAAPLAAALPAPAPLPAAVFSAAPASLPAPAALSVLPAASAPTEKPEEAATGTSAADAPAYQSRIQRFLARISNPFGTKAPEATPTLGDAERLDRDFAARDTWSEVVPATRAEIERLRAEKKSKAEVTAYVRAQADASVERILAARGMKNLGLHYNLHGGAREGYVGRGINATMGDIALQYSIHGDRNYKVYFFQTEKYRLYDILNESHPQIMMFPSRMGNVVNVFDLDAPPLTAARADGRIKNFGQISMDFHGMKGVPYSAYLAPPLQVFVGVAKKLGLKKVSRDEETLATVRYLEAALINGGPYIPKN